MLEKRRQASRTHAILTGSQLGKARGSAVRRPPGRRAPTELHAVVAHEVGHEYFWVGDVLVQSAP
jgi:hypothetical protein